MPQPDPAKLLAIIDLQNDIAGARMNLDGVMRVVVVRAAALTSAAGAVLELVDGDEMVYAAGTGGAASSIGLRLKLASSLSGRCVSERKPLRADDTETDPRVDREACRKLGLRSMICVPLFHKDHAVGVLKVYAPKVKAFGEGDVSTLELLAKIIAVSMQQDREQEHAVHDSLHDPLTGLCNRRAFDERLVHELDRRRRYKRPLSLALLDLDNFKTLNDRWGHPAGDDALRSIAIVLKGVTRTTDDCFRLGGDEFALLFPETPLDGAQKAAERIRRDVAAARLGDGLVGISIGLAEALGERAAEVVAAADAALYEEKSRKKPPSR